MKYTEADLATERANGWADGVQHGQQEAERRIAAKDRYILDLDAEVGRLQSQKDERIRVQALDMAIRQSSGGETHHSITKTAEAFATYLSGGSTFVPSDSDHPEGYADEPPTDGDFRENGVNSLGETHEEWCKRTGSDPVVTQPRRLTEPTFRERVVKSADEGGTI